MTTLLNNHQTTSLRLHRLEISNFMRIEALTVDAQGNHVVITGPNASGKTSAIEAIWAGLKWAAVAKGIPEPIRRGATEASIIMDLGEIVVERKWTETATSLIVTAADGSRIKKPQELLDTLWGEYALDPVAFLERRPQDQVADVLAICNVHPPVDQVRALTGEDYPARPGESADAYLTRLCADETGLFYVERRRAHQELDQKRKALAEQTAALRDAGGPPEGPEQSAGVLLAKIDQLQQEQQRRQEALNDAAQAAADVHTGERTLGELKLAEGRAELRVQELLEQLKAAKLEQEGYRQRIEKGGLLVEGFKREAQELLDRAHAIEDPAPAINDLRLRVQNIENANRANAKQRALAAEVDRLATETEHADAKHKGLDEVLGRLRYLGSHLLDSVDLRIAGLAIGQGELLLFGISFRQASQAQRIRVAGAIAMRQHPKLPLMRIDNGEHLDAESKRALLEMADENDFQVVMTAVSDEAKMKVEIVDGQRASIKD